MINAEVIVIGSGVAGAMVAYKLAKQGVKVAILEAGPRIERHDIVRNFTQTHKLDLSGGYPNESWAPRPDWSGQQDSYLNCTGPEIPRVEYLRVVGGTTWHWAASTPRLTQAEMSLKSMYGVGFDWPIGYDELEPWYCEAEMEMGVAGDSEADDGSPRSRPFPMPPIPRSYSDQLVAEKLRGQGIDFIARPVARNSRSFDGRSQCQGFGTCSPICPSGAQYHAGVHVSKAERLGATLYANHRVDEILVDPQGKITGVLVRRPDGGEVVASGKIFVLAANGIESPRLLLMSATDTRPQGLANGSGRVGKYFHDHPGIYCRVLMPEPVFIRGPGSTMTSFSFRDGEFRSRRAGWALAVYNRAPLYDFTRDLLANSGQLPPDLDDEIKKYALHGLEFDAHVEQLPRAENGIQLNWHNRDSAGNPRVNLRYSYSDYERAGFQHIRTTLKKITTALGAKLLTMSEPFAHHHLMGMTMMGDDPGNSVVDRFCRTHDHRNLFVLSSSVFPTGGCANPTLTIAAMALRSAKKIKQQLSTESG